ncbi:hypothetical protein BDV18DRAFT_139578 [Aspergillus unguis]
MPSQSSTLGWTLANWGSAPATWTASSCTPTPAIVLAEKDEPQLPEFLESCPPEEYDDCWPRPDDSDLVDDYLNDVRNVPYFSPGVSCPSGWKSVGQAARSGSDDVESTGVFTVNALPTTSWPLDNVHDYVAVGYHDALGAVLDPSETAIACCPSSMSVGRNGICYSTMPSHPISTACFASYEGADQNMEFISTTWVWHGSTRTANILVPTVTIPRTPTRTTTRDIAAQETDHLVAVSMQAPIYLVHRGDDDNNDNNDDGNDSDNDSDNADNSTDENAASGMYMEGAWGVKGITGLLAASLVVGMVLVPW